MNYLFIFPIVINYIFKYLLMIHDYQNVQKWNIRVFMFSWNDFTKI